MFIHFDVDKSEECDNCGDAGAIMHMAVLHSERSLHLCSSCFRALALALRQATRKLRIEDELQ
jgi:imidazoleglycerol phosphate dehydratase HisB